MRSRPALASAPTEIVEGAGSDDRGTVIVSPSSLPPGVCPGAPPRDPRPRPSRRSGSARRRLAHRVTGQPTARDARCRYVPATASATVSTPATVAAARTNRSRARGATAAGSDSPTDTPRSPDNQSRSASRRLTSARRSATRACSSRRTSGIPEPVTADTAMVRTPCNPSPARSSPRCVRHR